MSIRPKAEYSLADIRRSRSLLLFLRDDALAKLSGQRCADPSLRLQFLAESIFRLWLYSKASPERRSKLVDISKSLWDLAAAPGWPSYAILAAWLERSREERCFDIPQELAHGPAQQVGSLLRKRIDTWKNAAGVVPFVGLDKNLADAIALPFDIRPSDQKRGQVLAGDASVIEGLSASLSAATNFQLLKDMRSHDIWIPDVDQTTAALLAGRSAGLPLLIALRDYHQSSALPPFEIAATGILSDNGFPDPLAQTPETVACKIRMLREIGFVRILVAGPLEDCDPEPDVIACNSEFDLTLQIQELDTKFLQHKTLLQGDPHSIQKRMGEIDHDMTAGHMSPGEAKCQLQQLLEKLSDASDIFSTEIRAELRLFLATAECHLGNPKVSEALLDQTFERKSIVGEFSRTRAIIRQAVNLNDFGRYRDAAAMVLDQLDTIRSSSLSASQRIKLELDALGTAGQALTNLGLVDPQVHNQAYECLTAACDLARQLDTAHSPRTELPQDLCYLYQWHAFFDRSGCDGVWKEFETNTSPDHSSWDFMKRLRWLAAYRALLEGDHLEWRYFEDDLPSRNFGNHVSWLYCLARKYRGALRAAEGDLDGSKQDFEEAVQLIHESKTAPILQLLGVVAALEAVRSLSGKAPEAATRYRNFAKETMARGLAKFYHVDCPKIADTINSELKGTIVPMLRQFLY